MTESNNKAKGVFCIVEFKPDPKGTKSWLVSVRVCS